MATVPKAIKTFGFLCAVVAALAATPPACRAEHPLDTFPRTVLWAWERPQDLRFLQSGSVAVAFLAKTITVDKGKINVRPRLQPLLVGPETPLMAVVRIESPHAGQLPDIDAMAQVIADTARRRSILALQIDFDARRSERPYYRKLLAEVRRRLPKETPLSMTALTSWCLGDNWLEGLPVDEAVPMLFRMGPERASVIGRVSRQGFSSAACAASLGVALDEPISVALPEVKRRYYFSPASWTPETVKSLLHQ